MAFEQKDIDRIYDKVIHKTFTKVSGLYKDLQISDDYWVWLQKSCPAHFKRIQELEDTITFEGSLTEADIVDLTNKWYLNHQYLFRELVRRRNTEANNRKLDEALANKKNLAAQKKTKEKKAKSK
jgi:hypothetical protein